MGESTFNAFLYKTRRTVYMKNKTPARLEELFAQTIHLFVIVGSSSSRANFSPYRVILLEP